MKLCPFMFAVIEAPDRIYNLSNNNWGAIKFKQFSTIAMIYILCMVVVNHFCQKFMTFIVTDNRHYQTCKAYTSGHCENGSYSVLL